MNTQPFSQLASLTKWLSVCFKLRVMGSNPVDVIQTSDVVPVSSKEILNIQATIERRFTLKRVT